MSSQISDESLSSLHRTSSSLTTIKPLSSLPRLVTSIIFQNLNLSELLAIRECSSGMKCQIDDHIRRKYIKWKKSLKHELSSHQKFFLIVIEQFVKLSFYPPYIISLIEKTVNIATSCSQIWREYETPMRIEEREKLLKVFYEEADKTFSELEKKVSFTLTVLQILKTLDSQFTMVHPFNRKARLRVNFNISSLFFAIPFYNFSYDWFKFNRDWVQVLLMMTKFLEIKAAVEISRHVKWVNFIKPMNFEYASMFFGKRNPFSRVNTLPKVKANVRIVADKEMVEEIKKFLISGEFDWLKSAKEIRCEFRFACIRSKVCKRCHFLYFAFRANNKILFLVGCSSMFAFGFKYDENEDGENDNFDEFL